MLFAPKSEWNGSPMSKTAISSITALTASAMDPPVGMSLHSILCPVAVSIFDSPNAIFCHQLLELLLLHRPQRSRPKFQIFLLQLELNKDLQS